MSERNKSYLAVIANINDEILEVHTYATKRRAQQRAIDTMLDYADKTPAQIFYAYVYDWKERKFIDSAVMLEYDGLVEKGVHDLDEVPITENDIMNKFIQDRTFK